MHQLQVTVLCAAFVNCKRYCAHNQETMTQKPAKSTAAGSRKLSRNCFVTVGATASFKLLLEEICQPEFLVQLRQCGYTGLDVQCGPDFEWFSESASALLGSADLSVNYFDYSADILDHM